MAQKWATQAKKKNNFYLLSLNQTLLNMYTD